MGSHATEADMDEPLPIFEYMVQELNYPDYNAAMEEIDAMIKDSQAARQIWEEWPSQAELEEALGEPFVEHDYEDMIITSEED